MKHLKIFTDGGSRGNPGPSAIGIVIKDEKGRVVYRKGEMIGPATNNQAEYYALIHALNRLDKDKEGVGAVDFFLDSKLVVCQMQGKFKVKSPAVKNLWLEAKQKEIALEIPVKYHLIPRELNFEADKLLNQALNLS
ncbi:ribonuclease HI family protein [Patescibacteria group bacterium]|nr:ribonuclease HI family protein [Patescibacteria group bacterium]